MRARRAAFVLPAIALSATACARPGDAASGGTIQIRQIGTIGSDGGDGALSSIPTSIARDAAGRWLVAAPAQAAAEPVGVYAPTGEFLGRIGTVGDGPGEFRRPTHVLRAWSDSLLILDREQRRVSVLSPTHAYARSFALAPAAQNAEPAQGGQFFINAPSHRRDSAGASVFRFSRHGEETGAYGAGDEPCPPRECSWTGAREIVPDRDGVWLVSQYFSFSVSHWSYDGRITRRMEIDAAWFPPYDSLSGPTPDRPPQSSITGAWLDRDGRLWIIGFAADPQWYRGLGPVQADEGGLEYYPMTQRNDVLNAIIEVRDTARGDVLAFRRFDDAAFLLPIGDNFVGRIRESDDGWVLVDVLEVRLVERRLAETP